MRSFFGLRMINAVIKTASVPAVRASCNRNALTLPLSTVVESDIMADMPRWSNEQVLASACSLACPGSHKSQ